MTNTTIDRYGRVRIPADLRKTMEGHGREVFVTTLDGTSVVIYPLPLWDDYSRQLAGKRKGESVQRFMMMVNRWGFKIQMDSRGRIQIGKELLERTGLKGRLKIEEKEDHIRLIKVDNK